MAQREKVSTEEFLERYRARAAERDAVARATLKPLAPDERPVPLLIAVAVAGLAGLVNLVLYGAGETIEGAHPSAVTILVFSAAMLACATGMWLKWPQAVLAFMALLAVVIVLFSLFLVEASNLLGLLVPPLFIIGGGALFWKLVRVLARIQAPPTQP